MNTPPQSQSPKQNSNKPLEELKKLNREISTLRMEITDLHSDIKGLKDLNFQKQITWGVINAGFFWMVLIFVFQIIVQLGSY